ncbi:hypothetical protein PILCRDRAFT_643274 [Piloderma croceum F 1598]|uniref:Uncharacterized protein n=1 Tax=Piloderma croceum (strain F 1598) TaxID=765440 RepID=A0A0C3EVV5_PILCF|nr:hypothetical protein PILCRDRAFT_643274 [Piloderma croceum F 1598]
MRFILLGLQNHHKILDTGNSPDQMPSAVTPLLPSVHFLETHTVSQFACVPNVTLPFHQQTSSPQSTDDNNRRNIESNYMHSSSSGSLCDSSPARCSSNVVTPNTSPSPMSGTATKLETITDISSQKHQSHFDAQLSPLNVSSPPENTLPTPAPARSIGVIDDTVLMALTEPFLMAWCQDITQDSLALHTQDYWMDENSVDNLWCLDSGMMR